MMSVTLRASEIRAGRAALLEAMTDGVFDDQAVGRAAARALFSQFSTWTRQVDGQPASEKHVHIAVSDIRLLARSVQHCMDTMYPSELPIRIRLTEAESREFLGRLLKLGQVEDVVGDA